ncbi:MAG: radical SAM protein [bacterium]
MNVVFISPPETHSIENSLPEQIQQGGGVYPKLGLLYVASYFEHATGLKTDFIDAPALGMDYERLEEEIRRRPIDIAGISVLTFNLIDSCKAADLVKKHHPGAKVVFGGHHANYYPGESVVLPQVDYVLTGEGEISFTLLAQAIDRGERPEDLNDIPGLSWAEGDEVHICPSRGEAGDLNALPFPARHLINLRNYNNLIGASDMTATIQTSRGCPFACTFCDIRRTEFRYREPANVVDELEFLLDQGIDDFFFVDDTITIRKKRVHEICSEIVRRGLKIQFKISSRVDCITEDLLRDLRRAGCYRIHYGVESGTQRHLDYMEKGITPDLVRKVFRQTRAAGIGNYAYMMIGIPGETREEMERTFDFAVELDPDYCQFSICTPYPKTALYEGMLRDGIIPYDYWQEFAERPYEGFRVKFWNPDFSEEELREIQQGGHRKFYGRARFILREIGRVRSLVDFRRKAAMGASLLLRRRKRAAAAL